MKRHADLAVHPLVEPTDSTFDLDGFLAAVIEPWRTQAACAGQTTTMYPKIRPGKNTGARTRDIDAARAICFTCPVITECGDYADHTNQRHGVWGGTDRASRNGNWRRDTLRALRQPITAPALAAHHELNPRTVYRRISRLIDEGHPIIATPQPGHRPTVYQLQEGT